MSDATLSCHDVTVRFGEFHALTDVSIDFAPGRVTALIGPNGAGKTTLLNVLSGLQAPSGGAVRLRGADVTKESMHRRAAQGIARSFQIISIYPAMTVLENVRLGIQHGGPRTPAFFLRRVDQVRALQARTMQHLEHYGLTSRAHLLAGELSHGEQRALELSLSLTGDPSVLLLDEPLAGVGHGETDLFLALVGQAVKGRTTVLVEHNMDAVMGLADTIVCMVGGKVMATGTPQEIQADPRVRRAYLGE